MIEYDNKCLYSSAIQTAKNISKIKNNYNDFLRYSSNSNSFKQLTLHTNLQNLKNFKTSTEHFSSYSPLFSSIQVASAFSTVNNSEFRTYLKNINATILFSKSSINLLMQAFKKVDVISVLPETQSIAESVNPADNKITLVKKEAEIRMQRLMNAKNVLRNPEALLENPKFICDLFYYWNTPFMILLLDLFITHYETIDKIVYLISFMIYIYSRSENVNKN